MGNINKWIGSGNICRDPELRYSDNGTPFVNFSIGQKIYKMKKEEDQFIDIKAYGKTAEFICKYFQKGDKVVVEGMYVVNPVEKDGLKKKYPYILAYSIDGGGARGNKNQTSNPPLDDELPF